MMHLKPMPIPFTARAAADNTLIYSITAERFEEFVHTNPSFSMTVNGFRTFDMQLRRLPFLSELSETKLWQLSRMLRLKRVRSSY